MYSWLEGGLRVRHNIEGSRFLGPDGRGAANRLDRQVPMPGPGAGSSRAWPWLDVNHPHSIFSDKDPFRPPHCIRCWRSDGVVDSVSQHIMRSFSTRASTRARVRVHISHLLESSIGSTFKTGTGQHCKTFSADSHRQIVDGIAGITSSA